MPLNAKSVEPTKTQEARNFTTYKQKTGSTVLFLALGFGPEKARNQVKQTLFTAFIYVTSTALTLYPAVLFK